MIAAVLVVAAILLGGGIAADAHQINLTNARIRIGTGRTVDVEIAMKGSDIDRAAGTKVYDAVGNRVWPAALAAAAAPILAYIRAHSAVLGGNDTACRASAGSVAPDGDGVVTRVAWDCEGIADPLRYRSTLLIDMSPNARQVVLIDTDGGGAQDLLDIGRTETALTGTAPQSLLRVVSRYLGAGFEHIFLGYDHVAFLISVVLWSRRLWPVGKIVTAFTLAHSITLSLAALDVLRIPSGAVEPAIAASIVYVATENFLSRNVERRWRVAFCFGLIHGFGFASALAELGVPPTALLPALASFNIGVEIGQIAIVSLVMPVLLALDRTAAAGSRGGAVPGRSTAVVYAVSAVIIAFGSYWFLDRTVFST